MVEQDRYRHTIVAMLNGFHGRTLAGIAATGQEKVKIGFDPLVEGFTHVPFNDGPALLAAMQDANMAAVLLEPIQGESGIHPATPEFLRQARDLCDRHQVLLMFDEVQCGLGRTGHWGGWQALEPAVQPDAVSWAKGIAGGFPLGAIWVSDRPVTLKTGETKPLCDLLGPGSHGTTFGGTPLVSAGAEEVLAIIEEEGLLENSRVQGAYAKAAIEGHRFAADQASARRWAAHRVSARRRLCGKGGAARGAHAEPACRHQAPRGGAAHRPGAEPRRPLAAAAQCHRGGDRSRRRDFA